MLRLVPCLGVAWLLATLSPSFAQALAVEVRNESEPVLCAEKDNVALTLSSPTLRAFSIEAAHPAYINTLQRDSFAPDWTACDMTGDPVHPALPRKVTLYEDPDLWVVGFAYPAFWRPATVPVRIGERVETGLHLIQVWVRFNERAEDVLVVYPPDGYWRARPLPPAHLGWSAYGSSFLVGPVETDGRPLVKLAALSFDPAKRSFALSFERGGGATVAIKTLDRERQVLDVAFDRPPSAALPFAALRSMYITEFNNDAARVALRAPGAKGWLEDNVMAYKGGPATDLWVGRLFPSRHNTSAPDMVFRNFRD